MWCLIELSFPKVDNSADARMGETDIPNVKFFFHSHPGHDHPVGSPINSDWSLTSETDFHNGFIHKKINMVWTEILTELSQYEKLNSEKHSKTSVRI